MKCFLAIVILFLISLNAQGYELLYVGDAPTAGILQYGEAQISTKIYHQNGILVGGAVGLFSRFMFGISYGGENIVGNNKPDWNEKVEVQAKYRVVDESPSLPAVVLGFDSQGHGRYDSKLKRYDIKSKGFYAVASRNYLFMGDLGLHLGLNYSLETKDGQKSMNSFLAIDKSLGEELTLKIDYDAALNDQDPNTQAITDSFIENLQKRKGNGFLNLSLVHRFSSALSIQMIAYDILGNNPVTTGADRAVTINYNMKF